MLQVLKTLPVQVKERQERRRQRQEEDAVWAQRVRQNQRIFEEDLERERREKEQKKDKIKKDLDQL